MEYNKNLTDAMKNLFVMHCVFPMLTYSTPTHKNYTGDCFYSYSISSDPPPSHSDAIQCRIYSATETDQEEEHRQRRRLLTGTGAAHRFR